MFWNFWGFFCLYPMDRADDKEQHNTGLEEPGNLSLYPFPFLLWCVWDFLAPLLLFPPVPHYLVCLMSAFSSCPLPECLVRAMSSQQHLMLSPTWSDPLQLSCFFKCFFVPVPTFVINSYCLTLCMIVLNTCVPGLKNL